MDSFYDDTLPYSHGHVENLLNLLLERLRILPGLVRGNQLLVQVYELLLALVAGEARVEHLYHLGKR